MKPENLKAWDIKLLKPETHLARSSNAMGFTILDPENLAYQQTVEETKKLLAVAGTNNVQTVVSRSVERIAFLEACAIANVEFQVKSDSIRELAESVFLADNVQSKIKEIEALAKKNASDENVKAFIQKIKESPEDKAFKNFHKTLQHSEKNNDDSLLAQQVRNHLYQEKANELIQGKEFRDLMMDSIKKQGINPRQHYKNEDRKALMTAGTSGGGKSTWIEKQGMPDDVVVLNTDDFRSAVKGSKAKDETGLAHERLHYTTIDASYVNGRCEKMIQNKIKEGNSPHFIIDGVFPSPPRVNMLVSGTNQVSGYWPVISASTAIKRAKIRGDKTGRYVPPEETLSHLKGVNPGLKFLLVFAWRA